MTCSQEEYILPLYDKHEVCGRGITCWKPPCRADIKKEIPSSGLHQVMLLCDILLHRRNFFVKLRFYFLHFFFHKIWSTLHSLIRVLRGERAFRVTLNATLIPFKLICLFVSVTWSFSVNWNCSALLLKFEIAPLTCFVLKSLTCFCSGWLWVRSGEKHWTFLTAGSLRILELLVQAEMSCNKARRCFCTRTHSPSSPGTSKQP